MKIEPRPVEGDTVQMAGYSSAHEFYCDFFKQLREMGRPGVNVSRIRIRDGLLIIKDDKIIANFKDGHHTTIYYDSKKRIFGGHRTKEGTRNLHEDVVRYDIGRISVEDFKRLNQMSWRWVKVRDPHFSDLSIEVPKQTWDSLTPYRIRGREAVLDVEVAEKLDANMKRVTLEEFHDDNYRVLANFLRVNRKMTSNEIAQLLSVDPTTVDRWEADKTSLRFHSWGPVFKKDSPVGLIFWDPKGYLYKDIEQYGRLKNELMQTVRIR